MHCFSAYFSKAKCQSWKWFSRDLACNHKGTYWFCCPAFKQKVVSMYVLVPLRRIQNDLNVHWRVSYWVSYHSCSNCFREPENNNLGSLCFCFEWKKLTFLTDVIIPVVPSQHTNLFFADLATRTEISPWQRWGCRLSREAIRLFLIDSLTSRGFGSLLLRSFASSSFKSLLCFIMLLFMVTWVSPTMFVRRV